MKSERAAESQHMKGQLEDAQAGQANAVSQAATLQQVGLLGDIACFRCNLLAEQLL